MIEPFEAYARIESVEEKTSEEDENQQTISLNPAPVDMWDQWVLDEYLAKIGKENPYSVFPLPKTPEELSKRRAAFKSYDKVMETEGDPIYSVVNIKIFLFDFGIYFVIFAAASSILMVLIRPGFRSTASDALPRE